MKNKYYISIIVAFIWVGFVCAISFMESWLKFQAPGITLPLGLGIGRLVFNALNKAEWFFAVLISINLVVSKHSFKQVSTILFAIPIVLLLLQTFWLLPALDARAELAISGATTTPSTLHWWFVGMEVIKVGFLFIFGFIHLKKKNKE